MGCRHSKDAALVHRASSVAVPLRPQTPSFHAQDSKFWTSTSGSQANEFREELPSFVVSDSADLVGSSDGEAVHGMVSAFTFSFIQVSEASSNSSNLSIEGSNVDSVASDDMALPVPSTPPESLTFTMTGDPIELTPIPEEGAHLGPREGIEVSNSSNVTEREVQHQESAATTSSYSEATQPEAEMSPTGVELIDGSLDDAVSESTLSGPNELLIADSDASGISRRSGDSSNATGDTRQSVSTSELSEGGEYMVTETGAIIRHEPSANVDTSKVTFNEADSDPIERESIDFAAAAVVQQIIDEAVSSVAIAPTDGPRDHGSFIASSSLDVEPSTTGIFSLSVKAQSSNTVPDSEFNIPTGWTYSIVGNSTENGVVLYHVQLTDEVGDNAKWSVPLLRRYSRFSEMYIKMKESKFPAAEKMPKLPRAGVMHFVRGRQSKKTIEEREQKFSDVLRYIAEHCELHTSAAFQRFLSHLSVVMSDEVLRVMEISDKQVGVLLPDIDEDTRTESSEGSSGHHWGTADGTDSDDEFLDAVEPPLSTGLVLDGNRPPLSGVYVDAVEATVEQMTEAMGTTLSDKGSQSAILEGTEEEDRESVIEEASMESETGVVAAIQADADSQTVTTEEDANGKCVIGEDDEPVNVEEPMPEERTVVEEVTAAGGEGAAKEDPENIEVVVDAIEPGVKSAAEDPVDAKVAQSEDVVADDVSVEEFVVDNQTEVIVSEEKLTEAIPIEAGQKAEEEEEYIECAAPLEGARSDAETAKVDGSLDVKEIVANEQADEIVSKETTAEEVDVEAIVKPVVAVEVRAVVEKLANDVAEILMVDTLKPDLGAENGAVTEQTDDVVSAGAATDKIEESVEAETNSEAVAVIDEDVVEVLEGVVTAVVAEEQATEALPEDQMSTAGETITTQIIVGISDPYSSDVAEEIADILAKGDSEPDVSAEEIGPTADEETMYKSATINGTSSVEVKELSVEKDTKQTTTVDDSDSVGIEEAPKVEPTTEEIVVAEEDTTTVVQPVLKDATSALADEQQPDAVEENATSMVLENSEQVAEDEATEPEAVLPLATANDVVVADTSTSDDSVEYSVTEAGIVEIVTGPESVIGEAEIVQAIVEELTTAVENEDVGPIADEHSTWDTSSDESSALKATQEKNAVDEQEDKPQPEQDPVDSVVDQINESVMESLADPVGEVTVPEAMAKEVAIRSGKPSDDVMAGISTIDYAQVVVTSPTTSLAPPATTGSAASPEIEPPQRWAYQIFGFTIEKRVVLYHIHRTDRRTGIREAPILKRYNDFRELELQLVGSTSPLAADLPRLPKPSVGTFIRGRKSKKTIEVREKAFRAMLKYIGMHPELHGSAIFARFLEKNRDTHA
ncbi:hypothetical protein G195_001517 [Phytophthora kernoviae 00238/432]|uniref:PX domain-containing protein n=1 Tax=Phytophthora kernoviae 00238/432 TaxID=1284355 RepID=A0A8J4SU05_9STRA|nr:hypothetical protein G195_001517 [Phytophthora kernoviae 00238/432]